jgi:hypothetical protein
MHPIIDFSCNKFSKKIASTTNLNISITPYEISIEPKSSVTSTSSPVTSTSSPVTSAQVDYVEVNRISENVFKIVARRKCTINLFVSLSGENTIILCKEVIEVICNCDDVIFTTEGRVYPFMSCGKKSDHAKHSHTVVETKECKKISKLIRDGKSYTTAYIPNTVFINDDFEDILPVASFYEFVSGENVVFVNTYYGNQNHPYSFDAKKTSTASNINVILPVGNVGSRYCKWALFMW